MNLKPDPLLNEMFLFLADIEGTVDRAKALSRNGRHRECRLHLAALQKKIQDFNPGAIAHNQTGGLPAGDKD